MSEYNNLQEFRTHLITSGCTQCSLGFQTGLNGVCISRGNEASGRMIVGEAPGRFEDATSEPFVGPAGKLLDKILGSVGLITDDDFYVTNVVLCRPIAAKGSGKENFTPRVEQRVKCRPYLDEQIEHVDPWLIVTLGKPATEAILGTKNIRMGDYRGRQYRRGERIIFPMLHPAAILHAQSQPAKHEQYREQTWEDVNELSNLIAKGKQ